VTLAGYPTNNPVSVWHSSAKVAHACGVSFWSSDMGVVYEAKNKINGKRYVGKTSRSLEVRREEHLKNSRSGSDLYFHRALRKYKPETFEWRVLMSCKNEDDLNKSERICIKMLKTKVLGGYNLTDGGEGAFGYSHSAETKAKMSAAQKGRKHVRSKAYCHKMRLAKMGNCPSLETREKLRQAQLGKKIPIEVRAKMSAAHKGIPKAPEHVAKVAAALKGKPGSFLGRKHSEETKEKMRRKATGRRHTTETKELLRQVAKARCANKNTI